MYQLRTLALLLPQHSVDSCQVDKGQHVSLPIPVTKTPPLGELVDDSTCDLCRPYLVTSPHRDQPPPLPPKLTTADGPKHMPLWRIVALQELQFIPWHRRK